MFCIVVSACCRIALKYFLKHLLDSLDLPRHDLCDKLFELTLVGFYCQYFIFLKNENIPILTYQFFTSYLGADIIGLNCQFDPDMCLEGMQLMKEALEKAGLKRHLMVQPVGIHTPDADHLGFQGLPECPLGNKLSTLLSSVPVNLQKLLSIGLISRKKNLSQRS